MELMMEAKEEKQEPDCKASDKIAQLEEQNRILYELVSALNAFSSGHVTAELGSLAAEFSVRGRAGGGQGVVSKGDVGATTLKTSEVLKACALPCALQGNDKEEVEESSVSKQRNSDWDLLVSLESETASRPRLRRLRKLMPQVLDSERETDNRTENERANLGDGVRGVERKVTGSGGRKGCAQQQGAACAGDTCSVLVEVRRETSEMASMDQVGSRVPASRGSARVLRPRDATEAVEAAAVAAATALQNALARKKATARAAVRIRTGAEEDKEKGSGIRKPLRDENTHPNIMIGSESVGLVGGKARARVGETTEGDRGMGLAGGFKERGEAGLNEGMPARLVVSVKGEGREGGARSVPGVGKGMRVLLERAQALLARGDDKL
jgi:hypothetical protein